MKISSNDILNELKEISPLLASMEKVNVFSIPDGYFDSIYATVLATIKTEKTGLSGLSTQPTFNVPANYFETLAGNILTKIKNEQVDHADELRSLSATVYNVQNKNVFKVPSGYFDGLADGILKRLKLQQAKVVSMRRTFFKYAIAASIIGVMALGVYRFGNTGNTVTASLLEPSVLTGKSMNDDQFNETLNNLSSDEIATYLEKHNDEADVAVLTANLNQNSIPNQDDYLVDEKTLDNYLQEINSSTSKN